MSLLPKVLLETESPISGKIKVVQVGPERRLMVGGLAQSINADAPDVQERIWGQLVQIKNSKLKIKNCLILGLGGGTVAHLLTQRFGPIPIDGVEIDPMIVEIGKEFFDLEKLPNLNTIIANATEVVKKATKDYSLIIIDLYCGNKYPPAAEADEFFASLTSLLNRGGLIVLNRVSTERDAEFEERLKEAFGGFRKKVVPSKFGGENIVYTCSPTPSKQSTRERR